LAFFASSLSRTAFEALVVSLVGAPLLVFPNTLFVALLKVGPSISFGPFVLIFLSATVAASLMLVLLSFVNYQAPAVSIRLWIRSIVAIVLAACLAGTAGAAVFHRPWERFMSLEPPHGPPALSGATRPKLCGLSGSLFVLLPDGRIWTARMFDGTAPVSGEFLESTWKDLACVNARFLGDIERPLAAVRVDGSLWQFQVHRSANRDQPVVVVGSRRVGEGNDWTSVFDVRSCFVGKKSDRSLWGWGTHRGPAGDMEPCALPIDRTLTEEPQPIFPGAIESWDRDVRSPVSVDRGAITVEPCAQMVGYVFCRQELEERGFFSPRPSAYSDWLQASLSRAEIGFVALAADGTICSWDNLWRVNPGLLRQSARPQWCFNILTGAR
jgi:hypothetical protein